MRRNTVFALFVRLEFSDVLRSKLLTRRDLVRNVAISSCAAAWAPISDESSLRQIAAGKNILFGTEVTAKDLIGSPAYAKLIARECSIVTPGIEAKWGSIEPAEGAFQFSPLDAFVAFAEANRLKMHMHNLIWAVGLPDWVIGALRDGRGRQIMRRHIRAVVGRYCARVDSWDVVNEPVDPRWPSAAEGLCTTPWRRALGAGFVTDALSYAAAADASARLLINDDDLEYDEPDRERKRSIYLRLIEGWLRQGVRLDGFGLQAHLKPWRRIAEAPYRRFLAELAGFGLHLYITELDVCDRMMPPDEAARDHLTADFMRRYLDIALDEPAVGVVMTWGLSDRFTSMNRDPYASRTDGLTSRCLPYDAALNAKPIRHALAAAFRAARDRPRPG